MQALGPLEEHLNALIAEQQRAEEGRRASSSCAIQRAFREALLAPAAGEYDWFDVHAQVGGARRAFGENGKALGACRRIKCWARRAEPAAEPQRQFFGTQDRSSVSLSRAAARLP